VGLVAGWIAGMVMQGEGYGILGDIILGIIGAIIGGWIFILVGAGASGYGIIGSIVVAAIGAIVLVFLVHQIKRVT
jgi:uncharacterized membrane protein YeaQ/YmgE (transglycosylase-associated protein family)